MFERFTDRSRRVLVLAQEEARLLEHNFIGTEHLLLGLCHEETGVAARALEALGITVQAVRSKVEEAVGTGRTATSDSPPFSPRAKKVIELALREAVQLGHNYIGTEHLLLGLVREGEGVGAQVLVSMGADLSAVRQQVLSLTSHHYASQDAGGSATGTARLATPGPRCPSCQQLLEGHVAYRVLTVPSLDPDLPREPLNVAFIYCRRCGVTIAHTPTATPVDGED